MAPIYIPGFGNIETPDPSSLSYRDNLRAIESSYLSELGYNYDKQKNAFSGTLDLFSGAEGQLNKLRNMTPDQYDAALADPNIKPEIKQLLRQYAALLNKGDQNDPRVQAQNAQEASRASASDKLKEFAQHMMADINQNDPYVQQLVAAVSANSQDDARMRGLNGGYAVANTERAVTKSLIDAQNVRQQLGAQALGQAGQLDLGAAQIATNQYNNAYQAQLANMAARQQNGQAWGSILGSVAGAVGQAYGLPVNAQMGAQFGGGFGGLMTGGAPSYSYAPPAVPGYTPPTFRGGSRGSF